MAIPSRSAIFTWWNARPSGWIASTCLWCARTGRSFPLPFDSGLAQEATAHLRNVTVLDTSRYAVSAGTFPAYFLKRYDEVAAAQMQIDLRLFAQRIAPGFHIACRFVGEEPLCETTAAYNRMMAEVLKVLRH